MNRVPAYLVCDVFVLSVFLVCINADVARTSTPWVSGVRFASITTVTTLGQCYDEGPCGGTNCVKVPTSLPSLNTSTQGDLETAGGDCGTRKCWIFFRCAYGPPLASGFCP